MTIQDRGGTAGNQAATNVTSQLITLPTGWAAGDLLFVIVQVIATGETITQTGTGAWTLQYMTSDASAGTTYCVAWRVMQAGDGAPTFNWGTSAKVIWACGGFNSNSGGTLSIDVWATELDTTTALNSVTPNPATAAGANEASIILTVAKASATGAAATYTFTPPSGWTLPAGGDSQVASATTASRYAGTVYKLAVGSGSVAPGSESLTDAGSHAFFFSVAHALVKETSAQVFVPQFTAAARPKQVRTTGRGQFRLGLTVTTPAGPAPKNVTEVRAVLAPVRPRTRRAAYQPAVRVQPLAGSLVRALRGPPRPARRLAAFFPVTAPQRAAPVPVRAVRVPVRARPRGWLQRGSPPAAAPAQVYAPAIIRALRAPLRPRRGFIAGPLNPAAPPVPAFTRAVRPAPKPAARRAAFAAAPAVRVIAAAVTRALRVPLRARPRQAFGAAFAPRPAAPGRIAALRRIFAPRPRRAAFTQPQPPPGAPVIINIPGCVTLTQQATATVTLTRAAPAVTLTQQAAAVTVTQAAAAVTVTNQATGAVTIGNQACPTST